MDAAEMPMDAAQRRRASWGSVARRGAHVLGEDHTSEENRLAMRTSAQRAVRRREDATGRAGSQKGPRTLVERVFTADAVSSEPASSWERRDRGIAAAVAPRGPRSWRPDLPELPPEVTEELSRASVQGRSPRYGDGGLARRLAAAAAAYERDRYADTARMTKALLVSAPGSLAARELHGLACYRLGRWEDAIRHLELVVSSSEDRSQLPVLMDCYRATGRNRRVEELWLELKRSSPDADVLVEGRLVLASARAERGDLDGAINLLVSAGGARGLRHPADRHVRQWYLLGDLLEKSGDIPRAREMFERVVRSDPGLADAEERLAALGRPRRKQSHPEPPRKRHDGGQTAASGARKGQ